MLKHRFVFLVFLLGSLFFAIPATANLVDLEISTAAYKQFSFAGLETTE